MKTGWTMPFEEALDFKNDDETEQDNRLWNDHHDHHRYKGNHLGTSDWYERPESRI